MNRRLFIQKSLHTSLVAAFAALGGRKATAGSTSVPNLAPRLQPGTGASHPNPGTGGASPHTGNARTPPKVGSHLPAENFPPRPRPVPHRVVNVRSFGARGDGITNDTDAFAAASDAIMKAGGGTLFIPAGTYIVGKQTYNGPNTTYETWSPHRIIDIHDCHQPVLIQGQIGTKLKAAAGLRFGAFDPATGEPYTPPSMPFTKAAYLGDAYCMIALINNAHVTVRQLELDGNINELILGGQWGDTGRQCHADGLVAINTRVVNIVAVYTHHHGKDGVMVGFYNLTANSPPTPVTLTDVISDSNARQGLSWVGGIGLTARNCKFINTGQVRFHSAPAAGIDIEPDDPSTLCINGVFINCEFSNTAGCCVNASTGNSSHLTFNNCSFWGTKSWALWAQKPYMIFKNCHIHGAIVDFWWAKTNQSAAAIRFVNCTIDNDPSPVYGPCYPYDGTVLGYGAYNAYYINTTVTSNGQPVTPPAYAGS